MEQSGKSDVLHQLVQPDRKVFKVQPVHKVQLARKEIKVI
jgi:hypothetical protein